MPPVEHTEPHGIYSSHAVPAIAGKTGARVTTIRVYVVDESPLMADVLATVLDDEDDLAVVGRGTDAQTALDHAAGCDVLVVSGTLPHDAARDLTRDVAAMEDGPAVVICGVAATEAAILGFIEAGARGYVLRDDTADALIANVRAVHRDRALVSPALAHAIMERMGELADKSAALATEEGDLSDLTDREREVLRLIHRGLTNREIADALTIAPGTAKNHVHSILSKLNVRSRYDAAAIQAVLEES